MFPLVICCFFFVFFEHPRGHFIKVTRPTPNSHVRCGYTLHRTLTGPLGLAEFKIYSESVFVAILLLHEAFHEPSTFRTWTVLLTAQ